MRERVVVTDFSAGQITESYAGRIDQQAFRKAAAEIRGMVVRPDGGVTRRPGSVHVRTGVGITPHADGLVGKDSFPGFVLFNKQSGTNRVPYLAFVDGSNLRIRNLQDHTEATIPTVLNPGQRLETTGTFAADETLSSQHVQIWENEHSQLVDLETNTPYERTSKQRGVVYQNRLITADPTFGKLYFSVPLDLLNNDLTESVTVGEDIIIVPTGALEIIPDFYGVEAIRWLRSRGSLYLGTDSAEYEVSSAYAAYNQEPGGVMIQKISAVGTTGAVYFGDTLVMIKDRRLVRMSYQGQAHSYATMSMMELLPNSEIVELASVEYGSHRYLLALDVRKKLWCYTEARGNQVAGWSLLETDIWAIQTFDQDVYIVKDRAGTFTIEAIGLDNLQLRGNRNALENLAYHDTPIHVDLSGYAFIDADDSTVTGDLVSASTEIDWLVYDGDAFHAGGTRTSTAGGAIFPDYATANTAAGPGVVYAHPSEGGEFVSRIKTLPIEIGSEYGPALSHPTRVVAVVVLVEESKAFRLRINSEAWQTWESENPYSGYVKINTGSAHYETVQVEIESIGVEPLTIMSVQADVVKGAQV